MNNEMNNGMNLDNRCTTQRGASTCTDGCDLTSIYSVCALRDISECMGLDKEIRQRKRLWRELDDESSADEFESLDESTISIKGEIRSENTELELTYDFSNLR